MTAPYAATVLDYYVPGSAMQYVAVARVTSRTGTLLATVDITGGDLTFDEEWSPYVQATLTTALPGVDLDTRLNLRLKIDAGYVYPTGVRDVWQIADLSLRSVTPDHKTNTATMVAASDEALVLASANWEAGDWTPPLPFSTLVNGLKWFITSGTRPFAPTFGVTLTDTTPAFIASYVIRAGTKYWPHIETFRDIGNAEVYCDETRVWRIAPTAKASTLLAPTIATGDVTSTGAKVITEHEVHDDTDRWANTVLLAHEWTDAAGVAHWVPGQAFSTGTFAPATVGYTVHYATRPTPVDGIPTAIAGAQSILKRVQQRSRRRSVTALAAYWWRPRYRIITNTPWVMTTERLTRVTFHLDGSGLMDLASREDEPWL